MSATYDLSAKSAGNQTRIKDCFAARFGVDAGDVDDAFLAAKLDIYVQDVVNSQEYDETKATHSDSDLT